MGAVDRIILLSHPRFHEKNLTNTIHTFLNNGSLHFIFSTIHNNRLNYHIHRNNIIQSSNKKGKVTPKCFIIPYAKSVSESLMPIALKMNS